MRNRKGFTLIELLVVIAIIALLLSIIMPALGKAKIFAQEIICKTNLHQYHIATEVYANDFKDRFPDPWTSLYSKMQFSTETENRRFCRWHNPAFNLQTYADKTDTDGKAYAGPYWPYLAATKAHVCPTFANVAKRHGQSHQNHYPEIDKFEVQFSYSMNGILSNGTGLKRSQIGSSPSQTFLWAEENMWLLKTKTTPVVQLSTYVLNDNSLLPYFDVTSPANVDCFGGFHKISVGKLATQQSSGEYDGGVANVLFLDGSSTFATPLETRKYAGRLR